MALELKIISPSEEGFVKQIVWNADEIAEYVAGRVGYYKNLVYTADQIVEAKKDRAELNKFISALKAKDREIKKLCLQPYEEFHQKMQLIIAQVEEPVNLIDKQVKDYEDQQKAAKTEEIKKLFEGKGFQPWVTLERIWNQSWLNKSYSLKKIEADMSTIQHSIGEDILLINQMGEGQPAALREYQRTMDKTAAVEAGKRYIEAKYAEQRMAETIGRQRDEEARRAQEEIDRDLGIMPASAEAPVEAPEPEEDMPVQNIESVPEKREKRFWVKVTKEQLLALDKFLKDNAHEYGQMNR